MSSRWKTMVKPTRVPAWPPVFAFAVVLGLLLAAGAYWLSSGSNDKVAAAVLTFFGVVITAAAKHFVDMRSEQRLRLDAAMEAGKLLSSTDGTVASPAAAASGLLALADLGRSKLAVAMLLDLWGKDAVSSEVAILIIDKALACGDDATAQIAAEVLCQNSHKLDPTKPAHWPTVLDTHWMPHATEKTKILLIESLVEMSTNSMLSEPSVNALRAFAIRIVFIHDHEHHGHFRKCIAGFAKAIAPALDPSSDPSTQRFEFYDGGKQIDLATLERVGRDFKSNPDTFFADITSRRRNDLEAWALKCREEGVVTKAGALASASCYKVNPVQKIPTEAGRPL
jgi:hypothetical protein